MKKIIILALSLSIVSLVSAMENVDHTPRGFTPPATPAENAEFNARFTALRAEFTNATTPSQFDNLAARFHQLSTRANNKQSTRVYRQAAAYGRLSAERADRLRNPHLMPVMPAPAALPQ